MVRKVFIICIFFAAITGCTKKAEFKKKDSENLIEKRLPENKDEELSIDQEENLEPIPIGTPEDESPFEETAENDIETDDSGQDTSLLSKRNEAPVFPEDYKIGLLQNEYPEGADEKKIMVSLNAFFYSLSRGIINTSKIHGEWLSAVKRSLLFHVENGNIPVKTRFGLVFLTTEKTARANIRMYGKAGRAEGEVYLEKKNGKWLITDINADFSQLAVEYDSKGEVFEPALYRNLEL